MKNSFAGVDFAAIAALATPVFVNEPAKNARALTAQRVVQ